MKKLSWILAVFLFIAACTSLPYSDDLKFLVSAQANSLEFPVYLNGHLCTDMEGTVGLCSKRIGSQEDLEIRLDPQNYSYALNVQCPPEMGVPENSNVLANSGYSFTIRHDQMSGYLAFTCLGNVSPQDRPTPVAAGFEFHIVIHDGKYEAREKAYVTKSGGQDVLVLGQFARDAWVFDEGKWSPHSKDTVVKIKGNPAQVKAYSGSYAMRFNFLNMGDADGGVSNGR